MVRKVSFIILSILLIHKFAFATKISTKLEQNKKNDEKYILGVTEYVYIPSIGITLSAKLDTGAQTSSLDANIIKKFTKNGKPWIKFSILTDNNKQSVIIDKPILRYSRIKKRNGEIELDIKKNYVRRPVVDFDVCINGRLENVHVNLTNRSSFRYPMLLGVSTLTQFNIIVDPSKHFTRKKNTLIHC